MRFNLIFLFALSSVNALALPVPVASNEIEARGIISAFKKITSGGAKWPEVKAKLNAPKDNTPTASSVPYNGPIINGKIKGPNGMEKYKAGTGQQVGGE